MTHTRSDARRHLVQAALALSREIPKEQYCAEVLAERLGLPGGRPSATLTEVAQQVSAWLWAQKGVPFNPTGPPNAVPYPVVRAAAALARTLPPKEFSLEVLAGRMGWTPSSLHAQVQLPNVVVALLRRHEQSLAMALDNVAERFSPGLARAAAVLEARRRVTDSSGAWRLAMCHVTEPAVHAELERHFALLTVLLQEDLAAAGQPSEVQDAVALLVSGWVSSGPQAQRIRPAWLGRPAVVAEPALAAAS